MAPRVLRAAIVASFALALLALAHPASAASAPFCDDRGATALAPPPMLEAPDDVLRRASVACRAGAPFGDPYVAPAPREAPRVTTSADPALAARVLAAAPPCAVGFEARRAHVLAPPEGVGFPVERPPRG